MSSKEVPGPRKDALVQTKKKRNPIKLATLAIILVAGNILVVIPKKPAAGTSPPAAAKPITIMGPMTFSKDVASILFENCVRCHRPVQSAPFNLLTFTDAKRHAR